MRCAAIPLACIIHVIPRWGRVGSSPAPRLTGRQAQRTRVCRECLVYLRRALAPLPRSPLPARRRDDATATTVIIHALNPSTTTGAMVPHHDMAWHFTHSFYKPHNYSSTQVQGHFGTSARVPYRRIASAPPKPTTRRVM